MALSREELLSDVQVPEEEDAVKAILDVEEGLLNIYYLVFEGNVEVSKDHLSWIQTLYMERTLSLYGETELFQKYVNTANTDKYSLNYLVDFDKFIASRLDGIDVTNSKTTCEDTMKAYADTIFSVTDKEIHNMPKAKQFVLNCTADDQDSITWAYQGMPEAEFGQVSYPNENPTQVTKNETKWNTYFGDGTTSVRSWLKIPAKYHFIWRNKLIPAHELIHATLAGTGGAYYTRIGELLKYDNLESSPIEDSPKYRLCNLDKSSGTCIRCKRQHSVEFRHPRRQAMRAHKNCIDNSTAAVYSEEWASSAANGIIFLKYKKNQYVQTSSDQEKKKIQLEAIGAMCYMWVLIKTMRAVVPQTRTGGELERRVATLDRWVKLENGILEKSDTWRHGEKRGVWSELEFIYKSVTEGGLGNAGYSWANTYAKHIVALAYSLNFLGGDKEDKAEQMLTEILDGTIWERDDSDNGWRVDNYTSIALDFSDWESSRQPRLAEWLQPVQDQQFGGSNISPYSFIINPATGLKVSINERLGKSILINYLNMLN